jgi:hypothetical protein
MSEATLAVDRHLYLRLGPFSLGEDEFYWSRLVSRVALSGLAASRAWPFRILNPVRIVEVLSPAAPIGELLFGQLVDELI